MSLAVTSLLGISSLTPAVTKSDDKIAHTVLYLDSAEMMQRSLEGQGLVKLLNEELLALQAKIQGMEKELKTERETFEKQASLMTAEKRIEKMQALTTKESQYKRDSEGFSEDIKNRFQTKQAVLFDKQMKVAVRVCREKNGKSLIDVRTPGVHFVDDNLNMTQDALKEVDAEFTKEIAAAKKDITASKK